MFVQFKPVPQFNINKMNRQIKFRAWNTEDKKMESKVTIYSPTKSNDKFLGYIYMQYTGLKDKNGKEIYEGDIVDNDDYIEDAHCCNNLGKTAVEFKDGCFVGMIGEIVEIIGNIYENPKLLKKDDNIQ